MKLVEILARELKEWPEEGVRYLCQDGEPLDLRVVGFNIKPKFSSSIGYWHTQQGKKFAVKVERLASDHATAIVTRADWEAERANINAASVITAQPAKKADKDGWIWHRGGKCPVEAGVLVDVKHRDGDVFYGESALHGYAETWSHSKNPEDIMRYRLHKPAEKPTIEPAQQCGEAITAMSCSVDGPFEWRDRIREIETTVEALEEERASLVHRLESEGFRLIERVVQPVEDMSDWRNWKVGDRLLVIADDQSSGHISGQIIRVVEIESKDYEGDLPVDVDPESRTGGTWPEFSNLKFHSRPSA